MNRSLHCLALWVPVLIGLTTPASPAAQPTRDGLAFFESKIRPVLVKHCYRCHSAEAAQTKKMRGGLALDTRAGIRKGGDNGPAVIPGKVQDSMLIQAIRHETFRMPPKGKLPDAVIADFVKWVKMGAPDPRDGKVVVAQKIDIEAGKRFWSFQPLSKVPLAAVKDQTWCQTPVDRFLRHRQEEKGVVPNPLASPRTLIRRAYFDLIGLPPTPEQVEQFVREADQDLPRAYGQLVDRLLANKHHGERWARHWLDLARFAESNGYAFDKDRPNAYHYRDFVIRALNADMPYDQFVRLQIAGDLLKPNDYDALSATGFLVAGPFTTQQTAKERERSRYEQLDDMLNTMGTSLLGLTVGCARCHSHKYDPLPQRDYYRMAAAFAEVGFTDVGLDLHPEVYQKAKAKFDGEHAPLVAALERFEKEQLPGRFTNWLANRPEKPRVPVLGNWHVIGPFTGGNFNQVYRRAFPPEKKVELSKTYQSGKLKWVSQPGWKDGQVHNTLTGNNSAHYLFRIVEAPEPGSLALSLGSDDAIKVWVNGKQVLARRVARAAAPDQEKVRVPLKKGRNELLMKIVNGAGGSGFYFQADPGGPPPKIAALLRVPPSKWKPAAKQQVLGWYRTRDSEWLKLNAAVQAHLKKAPKPQLTKVYAAKTRGTTYKFGKDTYKVYFLARGNADRKEGLANPGFLRVLMRTPAQEKHWLNGSPAVAGKAQPARVALADWLTDTDHGAGNLLARVMVNRLWYYHFGRGIVRTPSDFGTRGERPSHPQLLDWLASELIRNGWKLKPIHKLIMTSAVYMQSTQAHPEGQKRDPENLLYWRREPRRLEAEVIRDALLSVSGTLDPKMFGKGSLDERTTRRSIYLTVKRSRLIPILQLFDAPDAMQGLGRREESTVAPQALALLNSPLIRDLAGKFARRVRPDSKTSLSAAVDRAYRIALGRPPRTEEQQRMLAFIARQKASREGRNAEALALHDFCHVLLCLNEFIYID